MGQEEAVSADWKEGVSGHLESCVLTGQPFKQADGNGLQRGKNTGGKGRLANATEFQSNGAQT